MRRGPATVRGSEDVTTLTRTCPAEPACSGCATGTRSDPACREGEHCASEPGDCSARTRAEHPRGRVRGDAPDDGPTDLGWAFCWVPARPPSFGRRRVCVSPPYVVSHDTARSRHAALMVVAARRPVLGRSRRARRCRVRSAADASRVDGRASRCGASMDGDDAAATSDDDGAFTIRGLAPGAHDSESRDRISRRAH